MSRDELALALRSLQLPYLNAFPNLKEGKYTKTPKIITQN